jgi:broad specificity phosphatase PhoE
LSILYLVRHGQAGTREDYDSLSDLGRRQARLLRDYFEAQNIRFDAAYCGSLARQRTTAEEVLPGADIVTDSGWDEFNLDHVYTEFAPHLSAADADFRREYEAMQQAVVESQGAHDAPVHRRWNDCDKTVVRAWVEGRYSYSGESWHTFQERIGAALQRVPHLGNTIVFTSATPIGICAARTLDIHDGRAMQIAGVMLNTSFTTLRLRETEIRLFTLNNTPHLSDPLLRTFR